MEGMGKKHRDARKDRAELEEQRLRELETERERRLAEKKATTEEERND